MLQFLCGCSYLFFLLSSQFYWRIRLKSTAYFFDPLCSKPIYLPRGAELGQLGTEDQLSRLRSALVGYRRRYRWRRLGDNDELEELRQRGEERGNADDQHDVDGTTRCAPHLHTAGRPPDLQQQSNLPSVHDWRQIDRPTILAVHNPNRWPRPVILFFSIPGELSDNWIKFL